MSEIAAAPCEGCPHDTPRAVAARGPVPARVVLLSGAPRYHEEHEGVAFASPAFGWLKDTLAAAGIDPAGVHYASLTGCRPPHQRPVRLEEIAACRPRLDRAIEAVEPEVIVLCGPDAVAAMLPGVALTTGHGRLVGRGRRRYYPIRHPYAALHHQPYVQEVQEDLQRLGALLAAGQLTAELVLDEAPEVPLAAAAMPPDAPAPAQSSGLPAMPVENEPALPAPLAGAEAAAAPDDAPLPQPPAQADPPVPGEAENATPAHLPKAEGAAAAPAQLSLFS